MQVRRTGVYTLCAIVMMVAVVATTVGAEEQSAGEAAGAGQRLRDVEAPPAVICGGCVTPTFAGEGKGSIVPYGRIELDGIYSNRNTNPLDPGQFNGYATAAGKSSNASSTLNPRYSVFGLRADRTDGTHSLTGVVEADFYSQTDNAGNISPRLRLANVKYSPNNSRTTITAGMDWTPIMSSHPNLIDFSIMGYNGNLWQRLPQITVKHQFNENVNGLLTVMRFERGLSAIQPQTQRRTFQGAGAAAAAPGSCGNSGFACSENAFNDPVQMPYVGTRFAYMGTGDQAGYMVALNAAFRHYRSAPTAGGIPAGNDINSYLVGAEFAAPLTSRLKFTGEIAYGQALGVEFFRYGQERNLGTGKPIRTVIGWGEFDYAYDRRLTLIAGYGFDNPLNSDLRGTSAGVDTQYVLNHRTYLTAVRHIWGDLYASLEWNHLMSEWSTGEHFAGDNFMLSTWYNF
ncbi:exported hypothetical protein [Nitrospira sp. ND1]|uniref:hypothetical protein n=1 Tax=Nitrospira sp. ND1 TaxID=1658518 RepID=UPI0009BA4C1A|nr:hypothetical protein [Nitrospira sp. ND1]SLM43153.1 exported hypothetical protein [Nitrospira sp. ND1]